MSFSTLFPINMVIFKKSEHPFKMIQKHSTYFKGMSQLHFWESSCFKETEKEFTYTNLIIKLFFHFYYTCSIPKRSDFRNPQINIQRIENIAEKSVF